MIPMQARTVRDEAPTRRRSRNPIKTRAAELQYARQLRKVARQVGHLISGFDATDPSVVPTMRQMLEQYAKALEPWAVQTASRMLAGVDKRDENAWAELTRELSLGIRREVRTAPTGEVLRALLGEQVKLIKSLPLDAAQRVHELTLRGLEDSTRASEIAKEIARSGEVSMNRATLIARTEVARTASTLMQARAQHVGSVEYIWRTAGDSDVRESHRKMAGKVVRWDTPPHLSDGTVTHAGQIYNCRCYPEPILPED